MRFNNFSNYDDLSPLHQKREGLFILKEYVERQTGNAEHDR